jgi:predicted dehydrogenase
MTDDRLTTADAAPEGIGVGMLGYALMGRAHVNAYRALSYMAWPPPLLPRLVAVAGRTADAVATAAERYGFESATLDWRDLIADERIGLFDNVGTNDLHFEPTILAAEAGKHVVCEKPLGRTAAESFEIWERVERTGVKHMCAFNNRFAPAVRLARQLLEAGELGEIHHFRGRFLQDWLADPSMPLNWRLEKGTAGSGALGDVGAHVIDLGRYLVGEIGAVSAATRTFVPEREGGAVDVDDAAAIIVEFENGAVGTIEASRFCYGRRASLGFEINGSKGSIAYDLERVNELQVYLNDSTPGATAQGFRRVLATDPGIPYAEDWWPSGLTLGWEHTFVHELHHFLDCIAADKPVDPHGATFEDGYRVAEVCDAVLRSAGSGRREEISYRSLGDPDRVEAGATA